MKEVKEQDLSFYGLEFEVRRADDITVEYQTKEDFYKKKKKEFSGRQAHLIQQGVDMLKGKPSICFSRNRFKMRMLD